MEAESRAVNTVGEPDAGNLQVRFDGGVVVTQALASLVNEDANEPTTALPYRQQRL